MLTIINGVAAIDYSSLVRREANESYLGVSLEDLVQAIYENVNFLTTVAPSGKKLMLDVWGVKGSILPSMGMVCSVKIKAKKGRGTPVRDYYFNTWSESLESEFEII